MSINGCANELSHILVDEDDIYIFSANELFQSILNVRNGSILKEDDMFLDLVLP